jgi:glucuronoarabinoxylan endo-1,4-beta-xylanase
MKSSLQAALVFGFVIRAGLAGAQQNLVTNPGFETGDTTGWFAFGSPTVSVEASEVHSGSYAAEVSNRSQAYDGIAQSFLGLLQSGQTYNVTIWLRLASGTNQTVQLTMQETDGSGTTYTAIASGSVSSSAWTEFSAQYTYNPSGTDSALNMYVEVPSSSNVTFYIDDVLVAPLAVTPTDGQCAVDWTNVAQRIDGFGASSAWQSSWTSAEADMFFGTNNGIGTSLNGTNYDFTGVGLSLLRNHISYAGSTSANAIPTTVETNIMQMAQARGALVWSAPWTPATGFKNANDIYDSNRAHGAANGGSFRGGDATNQAYASQLANYVVNMKNQGINLYAISVQNEPDANVTSYEACQWTGQQIHDFVTNLHNALVANGVGSTKIVLPESQTWNDPHDLAGPTLSDPGVAANVSVIADHNYAPDNVTGDTTIPVQHRVSGQSVWETEVAQIGGSYDGSITNAIYWAGRIYRFMTEAQANSWGYWWLMPSGSDNQGLTDNNGIPAKRMYALGQFSRFVRPGYYRIDMDNNTGSALVSAYKDPNSGNFAIVAINSSSVVVTQAFNFANVTDVSNVTPWVTSASMSLSNQTPISVGSSSFSYALPAMSIVTFVGNGTTSITTTNPPAAPASLTADPGNAQVSLSWTASSGATSYNVYRSTASGGPYSQIAAGIAATSYTDGTVANDTTYYYVVTALNTYGESAYSSEVGVTPCAAPAAPTGLTAIGGNAQIVVGWNASSGATNYNVSRATSRRSYDRLHRYRFDRWHDLLLLRDGSQ